MQTAALCALLLLCAACTAVVRASTCPTPTNPGQLDINVRPGSYDPTAATTPGDVVGWWPFDEPTGHMTGDLSGNARPMLLLRSSSQHAYPKIMNPATVPAVQGGVRAAALYSPADREASIVTSLPAFGTLAFWFYNPNPNSTVGGTSQLLTVTDANNQARLFFGFNTFYSPNNPLCVQSPMNSIGPCTVCSAQYTDAWNRTWTHVGATFNETTFISYCNGRQMYRIDTPSGTKYDSTLNSTSMQLSIGQLGSAFHTTRVWVDELRIYRSVFTRAQMGTLANATYLLKVENRPPTVVAGVPITMFLPNVTVQLIDAYVTDDGLARGAGLTYFWRTVSTPPAAALCFDNVNNIHPVVTMSAGIAGHYIVELVASDGVWTRAQQLNIVVFPNPNPNNVAAGATVRTSNAIYLPTVDGLAGTPIAPIGYWPFDETSGSTVHSALPGPLGLNGTITIPTSYAPIAWTQGRIGGALKFSDNTTFNGRVINFPSLNFQTTGITVVMWLNPFRPLKSQLVRIAGGIFNAVLSSFYPELSVCNGAFITQDFTKFSKFAANSWHHIALTVDATVSKVFIDGTAAHSGRGVPLTASDLNGTFTFGLFPSTNPAYNYLGLVDELAVYDGVLSNDELVYIYQHGVQSFTTRLNGNPHFQGGLPASFINQYMSNSLFDDYDRAAPNFDDSRISPAPSAYYHPRILFSPTDLAALRRGYYGTTAASMALAKVWTISQEGLFGPFGGKNDMNTPWPNPCVPNYNVSSPSYGTSTDTSGLLVNEAFRVLIEADSAAAPKIIDAMMRLTNASWWVQQHVLTNDGVWRDRQAAFGMITLPFMYDFLYNWMTPDQQAYVRGYLAYVTSVNVWSEGLWNLNGYSGSTTNWLGWGTGNMLCAIVSIENEDGFDVGIYDELVRTFRRYYLLALGQDGSLFEGLGKNSLFAHLLIVLAKRGEMQIQYSGSYNYAAKFLLYLLEPSGYLITGDDLLGDSRETISVGDLSVLLYAYPDDPIINFMFRNAMGDDYSVFSEPSFHLANTYQDDPDIFQIFGFQSWYGALDFNQHANEAVGHLPYTGVFLTSGMTVARNSWLSDSTWLYFIARNTVGGHDRPDRGTFTFSALGRPWLLYNGWASGNLNEDHGTILIDNLGQWDFLQQPTTGIIKQLIDSTVATFTTVDLGFAYGRQGWYDATYNDMRPFQPSHRTCMNVPLRMFVNWQDGLTVNGFTGGVYGDSGIIRAFRTAGLVRGPRSYAVVADDFQMGPAGSMHLYTAQFPVSGDLHLVSASGNDVIYADPDDATLQFLIRVVQPAFLPPNSIASTITNTGNQGGAEARMTINITSVDLQFKIIMYAFRGTNVAGLTPTTAWDNSFGTLSVSWPGSPIVDVMTFAPARADPTVADYASDSTVVTKFTRNGVSVPFTLNKIYDPATDETSFPTGVQTQPTSLTSVVAPFTASVAAPSGVDSGAALSYAVVGSGTPGITIGSDGKVNIDSSVQPGTYSVLYQATITWPDGQTRPTLLAPASLSVTVIPAPTAAPPSSSGSSAGNSGVNVGAIVGGVIGGLVLLLLIAAVVVYVLWRRRQQHGLSPHAYNKNDMTELDGKS